MGEDYYVGILESLADLVGEVSFTEWEESFIDDLYNSGAQTFTQKQRDVLEAIATKHQVI